MGKPIRSPKMNIDKITAHRGKCEAATFACSFRLIESHNACESETIVKCLILLFMLLYAAVNNFVSIGVLEANNTGLITF